MRTTTIAVTISALASIASAQGTDPASNHIRGAVTRVETSQDLVPFLVAAPAPRLESAFWASAVSISASLRGREPTGRAEIAALMEAALIDSGAEADALPLYQLSHEDIAAMRTVIGFPDDGDLLLYLLYRGPSLLDDFEFERYTAIRFSPEGKSYRVIGERVDRHYLEIGTRFGAKLLDIKDDPVSRAQLECAKTRHLNLGALPEIILAAKAFRAAERSPDQQAMYPLLVAVQALKRALLADLSLRPAVYFAEVKALAALRSYANRYFLFEEKRKLENGRPDTAFFAMYFRDAAAAYASLGEQPNGLQHEVRAARGEAFSLFAFGADAGQTFERYAALITSATPEHAAILGLFLEYLPAAEAERLGDAAAWRARAIEILGAGSGSTTALTELELEREFARLMATIGRPDIAGRFLMDRIRSVRSLRRTETNSLRRRELIGRESLYLRWLAPFIRDYYYTISFRLSPDGGWIRRPAAAYDVLLDFLDSLSCTDGREVRPGEVVVSDGTYVPYSALSPEEDLAAAVAVFGIVDMPTPDMLLAPTPDEERATIVAGIEEWVRRAASRSEPAPSVVPYLKLVWLEWFSQAFEPLKSPSFDVSKFRYKSIGASTLTSPFRVRNLLHNSATTPHQKHLAELFLDTREFLETTYW